MTYTRVVPAHNVGDVVWLVEKDPWTEETKDPIKVVVISAIETINLPIYDVAIYDPNEPMCQSYGDRMYREEELLINLKVVKQTAPHLRVVK